MRFGEKTYYCKKLDEPDGLQEYGEAVEITLKPHVFSLQPATSSGFTAVQEFGTRVNLYQICYAQPYTAWENTFKEGDVFYVDGVVPDAEVESTNGENANYVVDLVAKQNEAIRIVLKRR